MIKNRHSCDSNFFYSIDFCLMPPAYFINTFFPFWM